MHTGALILLSTLAVVLGSCTTRPSISLSELPTFGWESYRVDPYIAAAARLQELGRQSACRELLTLSRSQDFEDGQRIVVLCRMLFTNRLESEFRRAAIGGAGFLGDTDYVDWPLEPIHLVDGVPFAVTIGYMLAGQPEPPESYVRYCMSECDWREYKFTPKTEAEKQAALRKLLASAKWRRPLEGREQAVFASQIK